MKPTKSNAGYIALYKSLLRTVAIFGPTLCVLLILTVIFHGGKYFYALDASMSVLTLIFFDLLFESYCKQQSPAASKVKNTH